MSFNSFWFSLMCWNIHSRILFSKDIANTFSALPSTSRVMSGMGLKEWEFLWNAAFPLMLYTQYLSKPWREEVIGKKLFALFRKKIVSWIYKFISQATNQEFYGAEEVSCNMGTSIKVSWTAYKRTDPQEDVFVFFSPRYS